MKSARDSQQGSEGGQKKPGISYEGVTFDTGGKKEKERIMVIREETFEQFINLVRGVSLKTAFLMLIYQKIILKHRPFLVATFKSLANELDTDSRVLRRYAKQLKDEGLLAVGLPAADISKQPDEHLFTMGSKFERWIWRSKLFKKVQLDYVNNSESHVDKSASEEQQGVHYGPPNEPKGSTTDPQRVHHGPPINLQPSEIVNQFIQKKPLSSSSSSFYLSSVRQGDTHVSQKTGKTVEEESREKFKIQLAAMQKAEAERLRTCS